MNTLRLFAWQLFFSFGMITAMAQPMTPDTATLRQELQMDRYDPDPAASAVLLMDYGRYWARYFFPAADGTDLFRLYQHRYQRIKILDASAADWGNVEIPLFNDGENRRQLLELKAVTHYLEGDKMVSKVLPEEAVYYDTVSADVVVVKFAMPGVQPGAVLEIDYQLESDFFFTPEDWQFQQSIPVATAHFEFKVPPFLRYNYLLSGYAASMVKQAAAPHIVEAGTPVTPYTVYTWTAEKIPAFQPEPFLANAEDHLIRLRFQLASIQHPYLGSADFFSSWSSAIAFLFKSPAYGSLQKRSKQMKKLLPPGIKPIKDPVEKADSILSFVKNYYHWNEEYSCFFSNTKASVAKREGNSGEINLNLISLLRAAGLEAYPVLISTRENGRAFSRFVSLRQFNHVIAALALPEGWILMDATGSFTPLGLLPANCLQGQGLLIKDDQQFQWLELNQHARHRITFMAKMVFDGGDQLSGQVLIKYGDYAAVELREQLASRYEEKREPEQGKTYEGIKREWSNRRVQGLEEPSGNIMMEARLELKGGVLDAGNYLYFSPVMGFGLKVNPFPATDRRHPVNMNVRLHREYHFRFVIPEGFVLEDCPPPVKFTLPEDAGIFYYTVTVSDGEILVSSKLVINEYLFPPAEYETLRSFFERVVEQHARQLVLKRSQG